MKKLVLLLMVGIFSFGTSNTYAQLSKQERKELKAELKIYKKNLDVYKQHKDDFEIMKRQVSDLESQNKNLQSQFNDKDSKISELQDDLNKLRTDLAAANTANRKLKAEYTSKPRPNTDWDKGLVFKVQIGAFKNKELEKYFNNNVNFSGEASDSGTQQITLGAYRDYWTADTFKKYLREMGVKDAWIVPFKDGQRVELKDVLEGVTKEKSES